jgi:hypothetical protein
MQFDYDILFNDELITITFDDDKFIDVPLSDYWEWVKFKNLHHYCNDYYDASISNRHGQQVGKLTLDEYCQQGYNVIKADLEKFILEPKFKKYL